MSKIIEKPYDATQRISHTKFMGAPNLFTDADLNRQIEALKAQLDELDNRVGCTSDMSVTATTSTGSINLTAKFSTLKSKGIEFAGVQGITSGQTLLYKGSTGDVIYLVVAANNTLVTYSNDSSHKIAGALFVDGTSQAAANQYVVKSGTMYLTKTPKEDSTKYDNFFVVMKITLTNSAPNFVPFYVSSIETSAIAVASKAQTAVDNSQPVGSIIMWGGKIGNIPSNYHLCDGSYVDATAYPELAKAFGATGKFTLPDLRSRVAAGYDTHNSDSDTHEIDVRFSTIGRTGGTYEYALGSANMPKHSHKFDNFFFAEHHANLTTRACASGIYGYSSSGLEKDKMGNVSGGTSNGFPGTNGNVDYDNDTIPYYTMSTQETGSGASFNVLPKYCTVAYIIRIY